ncbi:MAG: nucleotide-binding protein [bacterium]
MKQITVISGKGGTGKTTIAAALAVLEGDKVIADCDVDAPNLHLILNPEIENSWDFVGGKEVVKDRSRCTDCGLCRGACRFEAIGEDNEIIPFRCEGCGVCARVCPTGALSLEDKVSGKTYVSRTEFGPFSHARLKPAEEASGKLVGEVRKNALDLAQREKLNEILADGSPGIGCPVISSITGADGVLVVAEPTLSGIHDMERALAVAEHFGIPSAVCINKYDINPENTAKIEGFCAENGIPVLGEIPFDPAVTKAMVSGKSVVVEYPQSPAAREIMKLWDGMRNLLKGET